MLTTILNSFPPPKCVIIQDSVKKQGKCLLFSILNNHLNQNYNKNVAVNLFIFENDLKHIKEKYSKYLNTKLILHDCFINSNSNLIENLNKIDRNSIVLIDSLTQAILEHSFSIIYKCIHKLLLENVLQFGTVIHEDTMSEEVLKCMDYMSTLILRLDSIQGKSCVRYRHTSKTGGKVTKQVEEYYFNNNDTFCTRKLEEIDPKMLLMGRPNTKSDELPENMSTFKISLEENEKKSRQQLHLPYLKSTKSNEETGNVIYNLDDLDDWDEEDPDDDLDI